MYTHSGSIGDESYAAVLVPVGIRIPANALRRAFVESLTWHQVVRIEPIPDDCKSSSPNLNNRGSHNRKRGSSLAFPDNSHSKRAKISNKNISQGSTACTLFQNAGINWCLYRYPDEVGNWNNRIIVSINLNQENDNYNRESTLANPTEEVAAGFDKLEHAFVQENKHKEL